MPRRVLRGTVVSAKSDKTVVVRVDRSIKHPLYGKTIRLSKKYHAHDENNLIKEGESVKIVESKPFSRLKRWEVMSEKTQSQA